MCLYAIKLYCYLAPCNEHWGAIRVYVWGKNFSALLANVVLSVKMASSEELVSLIAAVADADFSAEQYKLHLPLLKTLAAGAQSAYSADPQCVAKSWLYLKRVLLFALSDDPSASSSSPTPSPAFSSSSSPSPVIRKPYSIVQLAVQAFTTIYPHLFQLQVFNESVWLEISSFRVQLLDKWPNTGFPLLFTNPETATFQSQGVMEALAKLIYQVIKVHQHQEQQPQRFAFLNYPQLVIQSQNLIDRLISSMANDLILPTTLFSTVNSCLMSLFKTSPQLVTQRFLNITLAYESQFKAQPHFPLDSANIEVQTRILKRFNDRINKILIQLMLNKNLISQANFKMRFEKKLKFVNDKDMKFKQNKVSITSDQWDSMFHDEQQQDQDPAAKRRKLASKPFYYNQSKIPANKSWDQLYTMIKSQSDLSNFDMSTIDQGYLSSMILLGLAKVDTEVLVQGLNLVKERYEWLLNADKPKLATPTPQPEEQATQQPQQANQDDEEEDEYDPTASVSQVKKEQTPTTAAVERVIKDDFVLPDPPTNIPVGDMVKVVIDDMIMTSLPSSKPTADNKQQQQLEFLIRLASRGLQPVHAEYIGQALLEYFKADWKGRIQGLISWLSEEWYSQYKLKTPTEDNQYLKYLSQVMDHLVSFIEMSDRALFIRFLSELPLVPLEILSKISTVCFDPMRMKLGFQSLLFLIMFRPPMHSEIKQLLEQMLKTATDSSNAEVTRECQNLLAKI